MSNPAVIPFSTTLHVRDTCLCLHVQRAARALALLFIRLFRSLDAVTGGDETTARAWMRNRNAALDAVPADKILSISGLIDVLAYLDARRALV